MSDPAQPPFARTVDERGNPTNPGLLVTMAALRSAPSRDTARAFYRELAQATLLVAEHGELSSRAGPTRSMTTAAEPIAVRLLSGPHGALCIPAFTDATGLLECFPEGSLMTAVPARVVAQWVARDPATALMLNPRPTYLHASIVPRPLVEWIAQGLPDLP